MSTFAARRGTTTSTGGAGFAAARIVRLITAIVVGLIVVGILLVVLEAKASNDIVDALLDAARWLVGPFKGIFDVGGHKLDVAVNWGLAALIYGAVGSLIARLLAR